LAPPHRTQYQVRAETGAPSHLVTEHSEYQTSKYHTRERETERAGLDHGSLWGLRPLHGSMWSIGLHWSDRLFKTDHSEYLFTVRALQ